MTSTKFTRHLFSKLSSSGNHKLDTAVYETTVEERKKGWLDPSGPFSEKDLADRLGPAFVINRRFCVEQNSESRAVDDYSASFTNSAYGSPFKLDLGGVDQIASVTKAIVYSIGDDRTVKFVLSDGSTLEGMLHPSLSIDLARTLVGRTLDMSSAYRQLIISVASEWFSVVATYNPNTGATELDLQNSLPFGATAAVYGFNRFSRAIWFVGVKLLSLIWFNFYDDFPHVDWAVMGTSSLDTSERFFELLGWDVSKKPTKRKPFCFLWDALGVTFDFVDTPKGLIKISNKTSRVAGIADTIDVISKARNLSPREAESILGKVGFAESQTFNRMGSLALSELRTRASAT